MYTVQLHVFLFNLLTSVTNVWINFILRQCLCMNLHLYAVIISVNFIYVTLRNSRKFINKYLSFTLIKIMLNA